MLDIIHDVGMYNPIIIQVSPDKPNFLFGVKKVKGLMGFVFESKEAEFHLHNHILSTPTGLWKFISPVPTGL